MPNYVANRINMKGIEKLPIFMNKSFDFEKLCPMPESLRIEAGGIEDEAIVYYLTDKLTVQPDELGEKSKKILNQTVRNMFDEDWVMTVFKRLKKNPPEANRTVTLHDAGKTYVENYEKYGSPTWYEWCTKHWGTKWNAMNTFRETDFIEFDTAWNPPTPILEKLSERYPSEYIDHYFCEEGSAFAGYRRYHQGHCVTEYFIMGNEVGYLDSDDMLTLYNLCWHGVLDEDALNDIQILALENSVDEAL